MAEDSLSFIEKDCFGSQAACHKSSTPTAAFERLAVVQQRVLKSQDLNVRFHQ